MIQNIIKYVILLMLLVFGGVAHAATTNALAGSVLPITQGGTGHTTANSALDALVAASSSVASYITRSASGVYSMLAFGMADPRNPIYAGGAYCDGTHDDTSAFTAAANSGLPMFIPANCYLASGWTVPRNGVSMFGNVNGPNYFSSTPNGRSYPLNILLGGSINLNGNSISITGINFECTQASAKAFDTFAGAGAIEMNFSSVKYCRYGMGNDTGGGIFAEVRHSTFTQNSYGANGELYDYRSVQNIYASNDNEGVTLAGFSNFSTLVGDRIEFNHGHNLAISAQDVSITGVQLDRAYKCNIYIYGDDPERINIVGGNSRRPGRNNVAGQDAHICLNGNYNHTAQMIEIDGMGFNHGCDDGGCAGNVDSPAHWIETLSDGTRNDWIRVLGGTGGEAFASGGSAYSWSGVTPPHLHIDTKGLPTLITDGIISNDVDGFYYTVQNFMNATAGQTKSTFYTQPTGFPLSQFSPGITRKLSITCRSTSGAMNDPESAVFLINWHWESAPSFTVTKIASTGSEIGWGSGLLNFSIDTVASDASSFNVTYTNNTANTVNCNGRYGPL